MDEVSVTADLAKVVHVVDAQYLPFEVIINRGARHGLKVGDRFLVFGIGPEISDPDTGENLGRIELVRGRGEVIHVQDKLATLRSIEQSRGRRGKRITRQYTSFIGPTVEEEIPPEQLPFEGISLGDIARRI
jgi:hypothetical protein